MVEAAFPSVMATTLETLLSIFALILAGAICRRRNIFSSHAAAELNNLVVWLALPALLFDIMANASWPQLNQPSFVAAFGLGCAVIFLGVLLVAKLRGRSIADASIEAVSASYPNTAYIGFPLCLAMFGSSSLAPATIATIIVVCAVFAIAIVLIEVSLESKLRVHFIAQKVLMRLLRNPLILAPIAGVIVNLCDIRVASGIESTLKLVGAAASPCALVCLGAFLGEKRLSDTSSKDALTLALVKLIFQPLVTWWLAAIVFQMPTTATHIAVLLAALPTGTGPFMLAEFYKREAVVASRTILFSTTASVFTLSVLMMYYR